MRARKLRELQQQQQHFAPLAACATRLSVGYVACGLVLQFQLQLRLAGIRQLAYPEPEIV